MPVAQQPRHPEAQAGVLEVELAGAGGQRQALRCLDVAVVGAHALDHHRRQFAGVALQAGRIHHRRAPRSRHPDAAIGGARRGRSGTAVALRAGEAVDLGELVHVEALAPSIEDSVDIGAAHAQHAAVRAQPEIPALVVDHLEHGVDRQALRDPEQREAPVAVAQQPAIAGHPQRAVLVVGEAQHVACVQPRRHRRGDCTIADDARRAIRGPDPDVAVARDVQRDHEVARQALGLAEQGHAPVAQPHQPARGADPQRAVRGLRKRAHLVAARQAVADMPLAHDAPVAQLQDAIGVGARPQAAIGGLQQAHDRVARQSVRARPLVDQGTVAPQREPRAGPDPHSTLARRRHRAHVVVRQALLARVGRERRIAQSQQATVGPGPDAALAVDEQRRDAVVRQALRAVEALDAVRVQPQQAAVHGADPQRPRRIAGEGGHAVARQQLGDRHELAALQAECAGLGARVEVAILQFGEAEHRRLRQAALARRMDPRPPAVEAHRAFGGRHPHRPVPAGQQAIDDVGRQAAARAMAGHLAAVEHVHAGAFGADPEAALVVEGGIHHLVLPEALGAPVGPPAPTIEDGHAAARGAHHQRAIGGDPQRPDAVVAQRGHVAAVEYLELEAVVADEAFPGGEPEVAVRGLDDRVDLVVRKGFARGPGLAEHRTDRLGQRRCRGDEPGQHQQQAHACAAQGVADHARPACGSASSARCRR